MISEEIFPQEGFKTLLPKMATEKCFLPTRLNLIDTYLA